MADGKRKWFKGEFSAGNSIKTPGGGDKINLDDNGYHKTDGLSLTAIEVADKRFEKGFTPNEAYSVENKGLAPNGWYGDLLDVHFNSKWYDTFTSVSPSERFDESVTNIESSYNGKAIYGTPGYSKRDTLLLFNDGVTDYFSHNFQIEGRTPFQEGVQNSIRYDNYKGTTFENQDPVIYGFEIVIDAISSPLLNGSIDDFINSYNIVAELQARKSVYYDFKTQFIKLFKTKGTVSFNPANKPSSPLMNDLNMNYYYGSNTINAYANSQTNNNIRRRDKPAYLSHYLQRIDGLAKLVEANTATENKYLVDYGKDLIKLSFNEDVTGTLSSLAHLYKLLYWSKPNGKSMIPENLLRFNCDIIVSECRNFNRVRKVIVSDDSESLQIIKDNVSRTVYSLRECQFYFDKMPHDDAIDMGDIKPYGMFEVNFDYKYSTNKFEKWVADPEKFGKYIGYNNGAIWKIGNKGAREARKAEDNTGGTTGNIVDTSVPRFYTINSTENSENGISSEIVLKEYVFSRVKDDLYLPPKPLATIDVGSASQIGITPPTEEETSIDKLKKSAKETAKKTAKKLANFAIKEVNNQINVRARLLSDTINNIRNAIGLGGLSSEPKNVYPKPYSPNSFGIFFDVRNELFNFLGEDVATSLSGLGNVLDPFKDPFNKKANPLSSLVQKYGSFPSVVKNNTSYVKNTLSDILKKYGKK